jgi:hypothetical protein
MMFQGGIQSLRNDTSRQSVELVAFCLGEIRELQRMADGTEADQAFERTHGSFSAPWA